MKTGNWNEYLKFFLALFAIVNPLSAIPIFISLTESQQDAEKKKTGLMAAASVAVILIVVLFTGEFVLSFFGITVASFRVGGGILILLMAISMLHAKVSQVRQTEEEANDYADRENVAVVPLGTPLLAGPGAISTVILYAQHYTSGLHYAIMFFEIILIAILTALCFRTAPGIARMLGKTGINIFTRIMGLFMAAVGVEFIANGLKQLFPPLG